MPRFNVHQRCQKYSNPRDPCHKEIANSKMHPCHKEIANNSKMPPLINNIGHFMRSQTPT